MRAGPGHREPDVRGARLHGGFPADGARGLAQLRPSILVTPSDFAFARDGIRAEGAINQEMMVVADLDLDDLRESREAGTTVLPLRDSATTAEVLADIEVVQL